MRQTPPESEEPAIFNARSRQGRTGFESDLADAGSYVSRWQVTWTDLTVQHTEPENTITVEAP